MHFRTILTLAAALSLTSFMPAAQAQPGTATAASNPADDLIVEMGQAFKKGDRKLLSASLPQLKGHILEPWAAYWELRARLDEAKPAEIQDFMRRFAGTYQEDRLRADWLLLLGQRQDLTSFAAEYPRYRMGDDPEIRCYADLTEHLRTGVDNSSVVRQRWLALKDLDKGCSLAAATLYADKKFSATDIWRKARLAAENARPAVMRTAVDMVAPDLLATAAEIYANPARYLGTRAGATGKIHHELVTLAVVRAAASDPDATATLLDKQWASRLLLEEHNWAWGVVAKQAAMRLSPDALSYYAKVGGNSDLTDDMLAWKTRALLRSAAPAWDEVILAINAMSEDTRKDSTWVYWRAKAIRAQAQAGLAKATAATKPGLEVDQMLANTLFESIASAKGFYEQLALEELGHKIAPPAAPAPLTADEKAAARQNPGLNRALAAIALGLRPEGVREWNYSSNLSNPRGASGGMNERELLAAADLACERQVWDRCINTSERTRNEIDFNQRYPMPTRALVVKRAQSIGLDPAYVYGLIRQESRFITDARSGVGASGMMQLMPRTAKWTARKIGLTDFKLQNINDQETNIALGTAYLKMLVDDFAGSLPLATAAYNAGPGRPRNWRGDAGAPTMDGAQWIENIPFNETRDYVKKVLANTVNYAAIMTGQAQSLRARIPSIGPLPTGAAAVNRELP